MALTMIKVARLQKLRDNAAFRRQFAARRGHLTGDGVRPRSAPPSAIASGRTPSTARWWRNPRWGDYRRDAHRYKTGPCSIHAMLIGVRKSNGCSNTVPEPHRGVRKQFPKRLWDEGMGWGRGTMWSVG
jgi:hypothetical protein